MAATSTTLCQTFADAKDTGDLRFVCSCKGTAAFDKG
jgi:hypothetical protein